MRQSKSTKIPTPEELRREETAAREKDVRVVVERVLVQLRKTTPASAFVSGDSKLLLEEAARRFVASGWKCRVSAASQRDSPSLTVSAECLDCNGGGFVGYGTQERPCGCRSTDAECSR